MNAARLAGTLPPLIPDDRLPALKAGVDDLRNQLSPGGWQVLDHFLSGIGMAEMTASPK